MQDCYSIQRIIKNQSVHVNVWLNCMSTKLLWHPIKFHTQHFKFLNGIKKAKHEMFSFFSYI